MVAARERTWATAMAMPAVIGRSTDALAVDEPEIAEAIRYVRLHAYEGLLVEQILQHVPISRSMLERSFKKYLGRTPKAEILRLLEDLVSRRGMALILISHDLPLVSHFCDRVAVMYAGRVVEELQAGELARASHPYTRGLLDCLPTLSQHKARLPVLVRDPGWAL